MIDSAGAFFRALRGSGASAAVDDDAAIEVLEEQFKAHAEVSLSMPLARRLRYLFWNGALLGARIAARGWANRLMEAAREEVRKGNKASNN